MMEKRLQMALNDWQMWPVNSPSAPKIREDLGSSHGVNHTVLIECGASLMVLRVRNPLSETFERSWHNELACTRVAAAHDISPALIYANTHKEYLLLEYQPEAPRTQRFFAAESMECLAHHIASVHRFTLELDWRDYRQESRRYLEQTRQLRPDLCQQQTIIFELCLQAADRLANDVRKTVCHHDLSMANLLCDENQRPWLVDWEYACLAHPYFDLACVQLLVLPDSNAEIQFLHAYSAAMQEPIDLEMLSCARQLVLFYGLVWSVYLQKTQDHSQLDSSIEHYLIQLKNEQQRLC